MRLETILESKIENIPESTQLRRELRDKDRLLNAILFRLRQIPHLNQHLNLENLFVMLITKRKSANTEGSEPRRN